jgi:hypothetical protein
MFDMTGAMAFSASSVSAPFKLDVGPFKAGLYLVRIVDQGKEYFSKIQVMH